MPRRKHIDVLMMIGTKTGKFLQEAAIDFVIRIIKSV